jgi:hypothetical protein
MPSGHFQLALLLVSVAIAATPMTALAQENEESMTKPTSGGSLDIKLEPIMSTSTNVTFKVSFLNPGTDQIHEHQDYDFIIKQGEEQIFSAAQQLNQNLLHNAEGTITVPFNFSDKGSYTVEIQLLGLGFPPVPITPENAVFPVEVTPEFPAGIAGIAVAAVMSSAILLSRRLKLF